MQYSCVSVPPGALLLMLEAVVCHCGDIANSFPPKALRQGCDASCAAARRDQSREVIRLLASSFAPAGRTCAPPCLANEQEHVSRCRLVLLIRLSHVMYTYERHSPCDRTCRLRALSNKFCDPASNQCAAHRHAGPYTRRDLASGSSPPPVLRRARPHSTAQMEHKIMHMCEPHDRPSPSQRQLGSLPTGAFAAAAIAAAAAASAVAATAPSRRSRLAARRLTAGLVRHRIRLSSPPPRAASSRCKLDRHCRGTSFVCGRRQAGRRAGRQVRLTSERRSRAI